MEKRRQRNNSDILKITVFNSIEEENEAEYKRLRSLSHNERLKEFGILQERTWGEGWTSKPMKKVFSYEKIKW